MLCSYPQPPICPSTKGAHKTLRCEEKNGYGRDADESSQMYIWGDRGMLYSHTHIYIQMNTHTPHMIYIHIFKVRGRIKIKLLTMISHRVYNFRKKFPFLILHCILPMTIYYFHN